MREALFLKQNKERWQQYERVPTSDPDELAERFVQLTDDLAYARTFYPKSKTVTYLNGLASHFHLAIYNHFGQKMFETNDRNRGWNGQYKGRDMDTGAFVWYSEYQFNNELLQKRKGVVILIR